MHFDLDMCVADGSLTAIPVPFVRLTDSRVWWILVFFSPICEKFFYLDLQAFSFFRTKKTKIKR